MGLNNPSGGYPGVTSDGADGLNVEGVIHTTGIERSVGSGGYSLIDQSWANVGITLSDKLFISSLGVSIAQMDPSFVRVPSGSRYGFTGSTSSADPVDTSISRAAAGVLRLDDGSTGAATLSSIPVTPAQIVANTDNYAPTAGAMLYRLSTDASRDITGLVAGVDGQVCNIINVGSFNIVLKHDVTSTAANRFLCVGSADITLTPNGIAHLIYDSTSTRWRVGRLT
jgi:hypothetical protein